MRITPSVIAIFVDMLLGGSLLKARMRTRAGRAPPQDGLSRRIQATFSFKQTVGNIV